MNRLITPLVLIFLGIAPIAAQTPQLAFHGTSNGWMPWSGPDKLQHFELGAGAGMVFYSIYHDGLKLKHPWLWTVLSVSLLGYMKEIHDRHHHGDPEYADWLVTTEGGMLGGFVLHIGLDHGHHTVRVGP